MSIPLDSAWQAAGPRPGCQVAGVGRFEREYSSFDTLLIWLEQRGWSTRTIFSADGPDGSIVGHYRDGVTCILSGSWDGGDDSDSTYVPSDTLEIRGTCAATEPADTAIPH